MKSLSMTRHNFRNVKNNLRPSINLTVLALIGLYNFGVTALRFINNMVTVSDGPFAGLNRGQMRQMSWLFCMYR